MQVSTAIAIYFLVWWITLFAVLPFGVRSQHEGEGFAEGTDPGAPMMARIGMKLIWTTVVASLIFAAMFVVYRYRLIDLGAVLELGRPR